MAQINKPNAYFQTKLYTGGTAEAKTFDGNANLKPDWFWSKKRGAVQSHQVADSVTGITNSLRTDSTIAQYTNSETDDLASFDTNGFTFSGTGDTYNGTSTSSDYVAWCWSAGGGTTASNTDGSITSTVSANTTSGFSIVSYTGTGANATVGHGLGVAPKVVIIKDRDNSTSWVVGGDAIGTTDNNYLLLNETNALDSASTGFQSFSTTTVGLGSDTWFNGSSTNYIAYCFAEKKGYSKFGSYTGNGNTDGTFVYTGFKPAFVMVKISSGTTGNWQMQDTKRLGYNDKNVRIIANVSEAEKTDQMWDILSNGFKVRSTSGNANGSGNTYIYMAFAEEPLVGTNNIPATAR